MTSGAVLYNTTDDTATAVIDLTPQVDISVTKTDGVTSVAPGSPTTYTMIVSNAGPSSASGVRVTDALPEGAVSGTWTCTAGVGGTCATASGTFPIDTTVDFAGGTPGGEVDLLGDAADESHRGRLAHQHGQRGRAGGRDRHELGQQPGRTTSTSSHRNPTCR